MFSFHKYLLGNRLFKEKKIVHQKKLSVKMLNQNSKYQFGNTIRNHDNDRISKTTQSKIRLILITYRKAYANGLHLIV